MKKEDLLTGFWYRSWSHLNDEPDPGANYIKDIGYRYVNYNGFGYTEIPYEAIDIKTNNEGEIIEIHMRAKRCLDSYMATLILPGDTYENTRDGMLWHLRDLTGLTQDEIDNRGDLIDLPVIRIFQYETRHWISCLAKQHIATMAGSPGVDANYMRGFEDAIQQARLWTVETHPDLEIGVKEEI